MAVITSYANAGVAGVVSRPQESVIESGFINSSYAPTAYGVAVKMVAGLIRAIASGDAASVIYGLLVRQAPAIAGDTGAAFLLSTPNTDQVQGILRKGYALVKCVIGTPVRAAQVFVRVVADTGKLVGDIEATRDVTVAGGTITGTGTGTIACSIADAAVVVPGTYRITLLSTSQTAAVSVIDPNGNRLKDGVVGTAYTAQGLTFTITAGGTMTAADYFAPVVTANNIVFPNAVWAVGGKDSNSISEIYIA